MPMVIWVTGLSGAGKTTLCFALRNLLKDRLPELVVLDGDVVRAAFGHDLGHQEADRIVQVKRLQGMSKALTDQNMVVIVGVLYNNPELLLWNQQNFPDYFEVYIKTSLETVISRDSKGLYKKAQSGEIVDVVGIDIPWHAPAKPNLTLDGDRPRPPLELAGLVAKSIPRLRASLPPEILGVRDPV
ncbi:adenylyl-sulfate kinase [Alphaproteobacteria bacterium]|nr:adenylyl-sulfate kinase [Alphaproteobacteria bacterium]